MTKELRRLSFVVLAMFLSLFLATSWIQVVDADNLAQNPANTRTRLDSFEIQRGSIIVDGAAIASSVPSDDRYQYQRVYTDPMMWAPVTGYVNPALNSATGIESAFNADLSGTGSNRFFSEIERILSGQPQQGLSVELTLDARAQRAAYEALDGLQGAVVAIEPATGRVLAMASTPGYDTNTLAAHDPAAVNAAHDELAADPTKPLYNRGIAGKLNPPGSTFKVVVVAAALASGDWTMESTLPNPARYTLPGTSTQISNAWGGTCGPGETATIAEALKLSCNIPMAQLAVALGDEAIRETAERFGFNTEFEIPLQVTESSYPRGLNDPETALTGFGQGQVTATPLQMAMVSAGVGNAGTVMKPRMADAVIGDDFAVHQQFTDEAFDQVLDAEDAAALTAVMVAGVESGAATGARIDGVDVAGKTGTAQNGEDAPYTLWFTGFAPADDPQVAVAVLVEDGGGKGQSGTGNELAAPIAKKVIEAVLGR
ncbi:penicillin-binding protein 2 [Microbacterium esteraromaticum]|uniref:Penicillin-binding protein 2 n=1 Tax=Microbacterium esteraromaticum TaxID=57043 RepID=A0A939DTI1_9MICO|nr:penicillin-binding transpeptidase domain-containing protein [Microbacterium esteraromaticum]MBN8204717.1 penicillin-binding protein 2 [Microbacterium esteraromaticum]MBN8414871.1 penicillin-binding protein 2 [Microbacterium esteraromaticum]WDH78887.1 penicillin-binding transpeptidase domain-containing protein [Microbacterium esteraromaticum]